MDGKRTKQFLWQRDDTFQKDKIEISSNTQLEWNEVASSIYQAINQIFRCVISYF